MGSAPALSTDASASGAAPGPPGRSGAGRRSLAAPSGPTTEARGPRGRALVPSAATEELLARFRRRMEGEEKSPWTVKQYLFTARHFLAFVGKDLAEVGPEDLERWREHLVLTKRYAKASVYGSLRAVAFLLRTFGSRASEGVEVPRRGAQLPNFLTEEEAHRLIASAEGHPRDHAMLKVLGYGGLRVGELCRLTVEDLDLSHGTLRVRAGKGDKDRLVVVDEATCQALGAWLEDRARTPVGSLRVFPFCRETVERMVRTRAREAGLGKEVTPHTLRHTLATALLKRGLDLRFIQKQLGHASVATTQIYTHVDTGALREAYERARPTY